MILGSSLETLYNGILANSSNFGLHKEHKDNEYFYDTYINNKVSNIVKIFLIDD